MAFVEGGIPKRLAKCWMALRAEVRNLRINLLVELRLDTTLVRAEDPAQ